MEHVVFYSVSLINVSQIVEIPETIFSPLSLILLLLPIPTISSFPGNAVTLIVARMVCVFLVMKGQWQWPCAAVHPRGTLECPAGCWKGSWHTAFSRVHSALDRFWTVSALFWGDMCAAGQCSCCSPSVSWYPAAPGAHEPARVRADRQELGLVLQTLRVVFCRGGHTTCVVPVLSTQGLIRFKLSQIWHPDDWGVTEQPVVQKKNKRTRLWDRLLTAELPVLKSCNTVFLKHQLPELAYHWEQQFAILSLVS